MIGPLLLLAALLFGAVLALGQIYDIWAILAGRRYILAHGLPPTDPFSFTAEGRPWANQMWLRQVLFYWIYSTLGRIPLIFFKVLVVVTLAVVWWSAMRRSRPARWLRARPWGGGDLIVARESALAQALHGSGRWAQVFTGREAAVFVKRGELALR